MSARDDDLLAAVEAATGALAAGRARAASSMCYLGVRHETYPADLISDTRLTDSAKIQYLFLAREAARSGAGAVALPSVEETASCLGQSMRTAQRDRLLLRIARWITLARRVRDRAGRWRGTVCVVHDTPAELRTTVRLDGGYMRQLEKTAGHGDPIARQAARSVLREIEQAIAEGRDPMEREDPADRLAEMLCTNHAKGGVHSVDSARGGDPAADPPRTGGGEAAGEPPANSAHGGDDPCANFAHGRHVVEITGNSQDPGGSGPPCANFAHGECSSSKNTTTTTSTVAESSEAGRPRRRELPPDLRWPEALDDNMRRLIRRVLEMHAPPGMAQALLDALGQKLRDRDHPVRSPVNYVYGLCVRAREGRFVPPAPPDREADDGEDRRRDAAVAALRAEIAGLERLLEGAEGEARQALAGQLEALRRRLAERT